MSDDLVLAALARLEAGQASLGQRLERVEASQVSLGQRLDRVEAGLLGLRVDLGERMDRLQNALTDVRNDIGVNFGAADRVREANDSTRGEVPALGEMVTGMYRQIKALEIRVREFTGDP